MNTIERLISLFFNPSMNGIMGTNIPKNVVFSENERIIENPITIARNGDIVSFFSTTSRFYFLELNKDGSFTLSVSNGKELLFDGPSMTQPRNTKVLLSGFFEVLIKNRYKLIEFRQSRIPLQTSEWKIISILNKHFYYNIEWVETTTESSREKEIMPVLIKNSCIVR